jgi:catechol 2,3-dioxygenase-like lactoylglutathione lyase family enzyme
VAVRAVGLDHLVFVADDVEALVAWYRDELGLEVLRLDEWRRGEVLFVSLRVDGTTLIDVVRGERGSENVNHVALVVDGVDLDHLAGTGRFEVVMGPADLYGAQGTGRGLYVRDPAGNLVELRTYATG